MEPAVRGARIEPAIIAARLETAFFASRDPEFPNCQTAFCRPKPCRRERNFWRQRPEAKNPPERALLSAETGNLKIGVKESPQKRPLFDRRWFPRFGQTGWWCVQSDTNRSPAGNSLLTGKLTGNFAILGLPKPISLHETTVLQRLFTKFPTQINRENILKNREFLSGSREFQLQGA